MLTIRLLWKAEYENFPFNIALLIPRKVMGCCDILSPYAFFRDYGNAEKAPLSNVRFVIAKYLARNSSSHVCAYCGQKILKDDWASVCYFVFDLAAALLSARILLSPPQPLHLLLLLSPLCRFFPVMDVRGFSKSGTQNELSKLRRKRDK